MEQLLPPPGDAVGPEALPLSLGLYAWNSNAHAEPDFYPLVVTGSLLAVVPLVVAFVSLQRHWKAGLTAGSVK